MLNSTEHEISLSQKKKKKKKKKNNKNKKNTNKTFVMLNSAEHAQLSWAWKKF